MPLCVATTLFGIHYLCTNIYILFLETNLREIETLIVEFRRLYRNYTGESKCWIDIVFFLFAIFLKDNKTWNREAQPGYSVSVWYLFRVCMYLVSWFPNALLQWAWYIPWWLVGVRTSNNLQHLVRTLQDANHINFEIKSWKSLLTWWGYIGK